GGVPLITGARLSCSPGDGVWLPPWVLSPSSSPSPPPHDAIASVDASKTARERREKAERVRSAQADVCRADALQGSCAESDPSIAAPSTSEIGFKMRANFPTNGEERTVSTGNPAVIGISLRPVALRVSSFEQTCLLQCVSSLQPFQVSLQHVAARRRAPSSNGIKSTPFAGAYLSSASHALPA